MFHRFSAQILTRRRRPDLAITREALFCCLFMWILVSCSSVYVFFDPHLEQAYFLSRLFLFTNMSPILRYTDFK
jgi:arginyl-tRNA--protein-N-Asp/Glu arginylyltransferase